MTERYTVSQEWMTPGDFKYPRGLDLIQVFITFRAVVHNTGHIVELPGKL